MKSKTSSFNKTLFFGLWKRFWPLFTAYGAIWIILMPLALGKQLSQSLLQLNAGMVSAPGAGDDIVQTTTSLAANFGRQVLNIATSGGTVMAIIFCVLVAMAAYSYLYNPRAVSAMGSLPMKRQDVFRTQMLSGISLMLLINLAVCLLTLAVGAAYGAKAGFDAGYIFQWLAIVSLMDLFFYGFATMCATFTGNVVVLPLVYFVLNFAVYGFAQMINAVMRYFVYGYNSDVSPAANWFSPSIMLAGNNTEQLTRKVSDTSTLITGYRYTSWCMLLIYAVVGIAFACFAMLILKRRRMESAGDVVAVQPLKPAFKYCMTAGGALVLGLLLFSITNVNGEPVYMSVGDLLQMLLYMLLGGFIGYFASEMLMQKTLRVFSGKWKGFGISCAVIAALLLCLRYDAFGVERYVPTADEVSSVSIDASAPGATLKSPENIIAAILIQQDIINHKQFNLDAVNENRLNGQHADVSVNFRYSLKNGGYVVRSYTLNTGAKTNDVADLNELLNTKEAVLARKQLSLPVNISTILNPTIQYFDASAGQYIALKLSSDEMLDLYQNCIVPDTNELKLGKIWLITDESYDTRVLDCTISFDVQQLSTKYKGRYDSDHFDTTLTLDAGRTYDWIESHYKLKLVTMGESETLNAEASAKGSPVSDTDISTVYAETAPAVTPAVNAANG